ncbi:BON domain-containing protein [Spirilliplanes yamanashiensis]|uniref:BON domain-containing protein n=1 Tax=Spirilliplanes yamanashiensis TaxID=42233 RepID=A0A8J3Y745_9ACTN|nr:BON domain-containing protein [Spirilliplanes yamanashiensis]MDP9817316.1 hypothetical protein [Spirilliplanes yamanashiensis]GIJ03033.1 hypothetical protein Sya03_23850 [Spirilliplanes yamanashiensis]
MMGWPFPDDGYPDWARRRLPPADDPDVRLTYRVAQELAADELLRGQRITVEVQQGVVLLTGSVDGERARATAGSAARAVAGVRDVSNALRVPGAGGAAPGTGVPRFEDVVDGLRVAERRRWPRRAAVAVPAAVVWAALCVLMVEFGALGVAVTCVAVAVTATAVAGSRRQRAGGADRR